MSDLFMWRLLCEVLFDQATHPNLFLALYTPSFRIMTTTRGHHLTINVNMGCKKLLSQATNKASFLVRTGYMYPTHRSGIDLSKNIL